MKLMMIMSSSMSMLFSMMKHPMAMGLVLLMQTTMTCLITGQLLSTFWFSYILFMVFLGGMLVLFIYVTALASNEMFKFSTKLTILMLMWTLMMVMWTFNKNIEEIMTWPEMLTNTLPTMTENSKMLTKLYNYPTMMITIMLAIYMLLTLIIVVKITTITKGPLRSSS
nr:NADH dehydrogenase subunit 6 [Anaplecta sp. 8 ZQW-2020]WAX39243.1 NADH dehydrogenase subunit 6 [Anaplecta sp. 8 ZQW-2020]